MKNNKNDALQKAINDIDLFIVLDIYSVVKAILTCQFVS